MFVNLVRYMERELISSESNDSNALTLTNLFCSVAEYVISPYCSLKLLVDAVIRRKSQQQVAGKLTHYNSVFDQMLQLLSHHYQYCH